jgi:hypothetical protein
MITLERIKLLRFDGSSFKFLVFVEILYGAATQATLRLEGQKYSIGAKQ